jgi:cytochrome c oxidase cbb3-type subunit 1
MSVVQTAPAQPWIAEADSAARRAAFSSVGWLLLAVTAGAGVHVELLFPDAANRIDLLAFAHLRAVHDTSVVFGWLTVTAFLAAFAILPRLAGVQLHNERLGRGALGAWNTLLFVGMFFLLFGANQGRPLGELPVGFDVGLTLVMASITYNAGITLARRRERTLYVSAWYLFAALLFFPVVYVFGNLTLLSGVRDAIVSGFYTQALQWLWLVPALVGALYYVIPTATGNPLHSRRLAAIGFWSLVAVGGWTGQRTGVWGPTQDYLQSIAIAMSFVLLVPVLSAVSNVFATARGRWMAAVDDFALRFALAGCVLLVAWTVLAASSSLRPFARLVGLTAWEGGLRHLAVYGALGSLAFSAFYHLFPRITGHAWYSRRLGSLHFWLTIVGVTAGAAVRLGQGLVQGSVALSSGGHVADAARFNSSMSRGFDAVALVAFLVLAVGQYVFAWNAFRTTARGDPYVLVRGNAP